MRTCPQGATCKFRDCKKQFFTDTFSGNPFPYSSSLFGSLWPSIFQQHFWDTVTCFCQLFKEFKFLLQRWRSYFKREHCKIITLQHLNDEAFTAGAPGTVSGSRDLWRQEDPPVRPWPWLLLTKSTQGPKLHGKYSETHLTQTPW